jgi:hypothetical protein
VSIELLWAGTGNRRLPESCDSAEAGEPATNTRLNSSERTTAARENRFADDMYSLSNYLFLGLFPKRGKSYSKNFAAPQLSPELHLNLRRMPFKPEGVALWPPVP